MNLSERQRLHVQLISRLIHYVYNQGYELTWGEVYKPECGVDFQLFENGICLTDGKAYDFMGLYWKQLDPLCRWGGDLKPARINYFSLTLGGRS